MFFPTEKVDAFKNIYCLLLPFSFIFLKKKKIYTSTVSALQKFLTFIYTDLHLELPRPMVLPLNPDGGT